MGRFLQIAMGSASELGYLIRLAKDLDYFETCEYQRFDTELSEIRRMLTSFYKRVRRPAEGRIGPQFAKS
jgi:four helix bundle protein